MKKRGLLFTMSIALVVVAAITMTGCPTPTATSPGLLTAILTGAPDPGADGDFFLVGIFNVGDDPQTATPLGSVTATIGGGTASDVVNDGNPTFNDVTLPAGTYQFSALIDENGNFLPDTGEKVVLTTVTVNGDTTFTVNYSGFFDAP